MRWKQAKVKPDFQKLCGTLTSPNRRSTVGFEGPSGESGVKCRLGSTLRENSRQPGRDGEAPGALIKA